MLPMLLGLILLVMLLLVLPKMLFMLLCMLLRMLMALLLPLLLTVLLQFNSIQFNSNELKLKTKKFTYPASFFVAMSRQQYVGPVEELGREERRERRER